MVMFTVVINIHVHTVLFYFQRYNLQTVTYWNGSHYTCAMKLNKPTVPESGWYFYDGLQVKANGIGLMRCLNLPTTPQGSLLSHAVYILNV